MAKLNRERALVERRLRKQAKKDARKQAAAAASASTPDETLIPDARESRAREGLARRPD